MGFSLQVSIQYISIPLQSAACMQRLIERPWGYKLGTSPTKEQTPVSKKLLSFAVPALLATLPLVRAQSPVTFTAAQASQGQSAYGQNCAGCHGAGLDDGEFAPPVK